jgi:FtsH-binding integral membrane protein
MGLGLWNYPALALALEAVLLFGGIFLYLRATSAVSTIGKYGAPVFGVILLLIQGVVFFGAPPPTAAAAALTGFLAYVVLAGITYWLEKKRQ